MEAVVFLGVQLEQMTSGQTFWQRIHQFAIPVIGWVGLFLTLFVEGARLFGAHWFFFDLLRHIPLQVAWSTGGVLFTALVLGLFRPDRDELQGPSFGLRGKKTLWRSVWRGNRRRHRWWWPLFVLFLLQVGRVLPFMASVPAESASETTAFSVMSTNVLTGNLELAELNAWILQNEPDVVVLVEVGERQLDALSPALSAFPHSLVLPHESPLGMALFSKFSFAEHDVVAVEHSPSALRVLLNLPGKVGALGSQHLEKVEVWAVHPMPPVNEKWAAIRDRALQQLASEVVRSKHPVVLAGDFNATPWSVIFANFLDESGLHNAAMARGGRPTWPTFLPVALRIPIDHILLSESLSSTSFLVGPEMGSDHLPIFSTIRLMDK